MCYFGGYMEVEIGEVLGLIECIVCCDWDKVWLMLFVLLC